MARHGKRGGGTTFPTEDSARKHGGSGKGRGIIDAMTVPVSTGVAANLGPPLRSRATKKSRPTDDALVATRSVGPACCWRELSCELLRCAKHAPSRRDRGPNGKHLRYEAGCSSTEITAIDDKTPFLLLFLVQQARPREGISIR